MKKSLIYFVSIILIAGFLSGCGELKKMVDRAGEVSYKSKPDPVEMHAGKVPINVSVTFPAKYFGKKVKLVITPALKADDGNDDVTFPVQTVIGEKFKDNYTRISYKEGGSFSFKDTIDYRPSLRMSDLELRFQLQAEGKEEKASITTVKVADGIITTPELVQGGMKVDGNGSGTGQTIKETVSKPTVMTDTKEAKIFYDLQKANIKRSELKKAEIDSLLSFIKNAADDPEKELSKIKISSYASPDGPEDLNQSLVTDRGKNSKDAFMKLVKKAGIEKAEGAEFYMTETTPAEDWEGFKKLVSESNMQDKELVLRVLSMYSDPVVREREIKNLAAVYDNLRKDILPMLRRSNIVFDYQSKAKEDAEMVKIALANPENLKQNELLYAAYAEKDAAKKEQIYKSYTSKYPNDWKAWNNLGTAQVELGKYSDAKASFEKVLDLQSNNGGAFNNLGVIAMAEGDDEKAYDYFEKAEEAGATSPAVGYNMGVILIKRAQYSDAVAKFKEDKFNKALAETLAGDNESAINTLKNMGSNDNGLFYYLKAVVAAKAEMEGDVYENLKIAVAKDNTLKEYAKNDLEFRKFFDKEGFKSIVE